MGMTVMTTDISADAYLARMAIVEAAAFVAAPHTRMRPRVYLDGTAWCALYGESIMEGVCGFGASPAEACADFDRAWSKHHTGAQP